MDVEKTGLGNRIEWTHGPEATGHARAAASDERASQPVVDVLDLRAWPKELGKPEFLMAFPLDGADPAEAGVVHKRASQVGNVVVATSTGGTPKLDSYKWWQVISWVVGPPRWVAKYVTEELPGDASFAAPSRFADFLTPAGLERLKRMNGLIIPGGEGKGMPAFLNDPDLIALVREAVKLGIPIYAECHGVLTLVNADVLDALLDRAAQAGNADPTVTTTPELAEKMGVIGFWLSGRERVYGGFENFAADIVEADVGRRRFSPSTLGPFGRHIRRPDETEGVRVAGKLVTSAGPKDPEAGFAAFLAVVRDDMIDRARQQKSAAGTTSVRP